MSNDILQSWQIHNNINLYLLDAIDEKFLADISASKGRSVGDQFAHMHNVRLMWLKASKPELMKGVDKIEKETKLTVKLLKTELVKSAKAIENLLKEGFEEGKIKGFKPNPTAFFSYLISHESHHRGQIILALKQSGHQLDQKILYGIWEWGSRQ